jgi:hypothetical protein
VSVLTDSCKRYISKDIRNLLSALEDVVDRGVGVAEENEGVGEQVDVGEELDHQPGKKSDPQVPGI